MTAPRPYVSLLRAAAAAGTRAQVLSAAAGLLREQHRLADFSLDAVAKAAGVTRVTVYKQFGSRRGLLEAVFDELAASGGLARIPQAMSAADPRKSVAQLAAVFCEFWGSDPAVGRVNEAGAVDAELGEAIAQRNERRRTALAVLVKRACAGRRIGTHRMADATDLLFAFTSYDMFKALRTNRTVPRVCALVQRACDRVLDDLAA